MQHSEALKRRDDLANQLTDSNQMPPWIGEERRTDELSRLCESILAITADKDITFICHNIAEEDYNSMVGDVVAFTEDLVIKASLRWRNGDIGAVTVSAFPRGSITKLEITAVDPLERETRRRPEWPNRVGISISLKDATMYLPLPCEAGHKPTEATETALIQLLSELASKDLASA
ncbi:hypothetical protein [Pseudarthrobacter sp. N5]|uniref:hypothetical protein n=1 Tax=Pseudarthrobacter sp. N5 TaxID=3418416 RepID=UPI003CEB6124